MGQVNGHVKGRSMGALFMASNGACERDTARVGTFHGGAGGNGHVKGWLVMETF